MAGYTAEEQALISKTEQAMLPRWMRDCPRCDGTGVVSKGGFFAWANKKDCEYCDGSGVRGHEGGQNNEKLLELVAHVDKLLAKGKV